jgi:uncharacterized BrkB/YihY/UPF0761 family membrane protein
MPKKRLPAETVPRLLAVQKSGLLQEIQKGTKQMITESSVYWILKLDDIRDFAFGLGVITTFLVVAFLVFFLAAKIGKDEFCSDYKQVGRVCGWLGATTAILTLFFHLSYTLLPTTKQMAMIKVIPAIANSEIVGEMSADAKEIYRMGIKAIKEALSENKGQSK